jgi:hypothetical protein
MAGIFLGVVGSCCKHLHFTGATLEKFFSVVIPVVHFLNKMPTITSELTLYDPVHVQRAMATVNKNPQRTSCPEYTRNVWLYLKYTLQKQSTSQNTSLTTTQDNILKTQSAIENCLPAM